ncbi:MAG: helix-turn-helix domain-containing protein [Cyanobacteria bacterium J06633_8]
MTVTKKDKNFARQLYQEGKSTKEISVECGVNVRTAQRWVKSFQGESVIVTNLADPEAEVIQPIPALEKIADAPKEQSSRLLANHSGI